jgi:hypothetical protein
MTDPWAQLESTARRIEVSGIQEMDLKDVRFAVKSLDSRDKRHGKVAYRAFLREVLEKTQTQVPSYVARLHLSRAVSAS